MEWILKTRDIKILLTICVPLWQLSSYMLVASVAVCDRARSRWIQGVTAVDALCVNFCELLCGMLHYMLLYIYHWFDYQILLHCICGMFQGCSSYFLFLVIYKISIISSIGAMECQLSMRCCANLDFPFPYLKSQKCSWNLTAILSNIFFYLNKWYTRTKGS